MWRRGRCPLVLFPSLSVGACPHSSLLLVLIPLLKECICGWPSPFLSDLSNLEGLSLPLGFKELLCLIIFLGGVPIQGKPLLTSVISKSRQEAEWGGEDSRGLLIVNCEGGTGQGQGNGQYSQGKGTKAERSGHPELGLLTFSKPKV